MSLVLRSDASTRVQPAGRKKVAQGVSPGNDDSVNGQPRQGRKSAPTLGWVLPDVVFFRPFRGLSRGGRPHPRAHALGYPLPPLSGLAARSEGEIEIEDENDGEGKHECEARQGQP